MYQAILDAIGERPAPYAPMAFPFWDDPYISKHFLAAHLDPEKEGATRRHDFVRRSAEWIAGLGSGALLDLGCGPGIYAELFAQRGFSVMGVDMSARSIAYAKDSAAQKGLDIAYVCRNYLDISYENRFDVAVLIYCDLGVLPPADRHRALSNAYRALKPGGLFITDAWTAAHYRDFREGWQVEQSQGEGFWSPEPCAMLKHDLSYAGGLYLELYHIITAAQVRSYYLWNQAFDPAGLAAELTLAGFDEIGFFGDVAGTALSAESETLCAVARK